MDSSTPSIIVRPSRVDDAPALCELLNEIIRIGGTTAIEAPMSALAFGDCFLRGADHIGCLLAEDGTGAVLGFQALEHRPDLPNDCGDIATFARLEPKTPGVGRALFAETLLLAKKAGLTALNATIRADNLGGLAYYMKMGFRDHAVKPGVPLRDGTPVDRISKRFLID